eukprot:TRINITY_DN768_c0_g1_i1.p1 TRINITY_DN768_c0_g1~~TRINITY_DN768_c0_g1_i1.p1  ORF type:complete len:396 (+),score=88.61 TRINITY_DN768_c0_g1_i1:45-1232(+)
MSKSLFIFLSLFLAAAALTIMDRKADLTQVCARYMNVTTAVPTMRALIGQVVQNVLADNSISGFFTGDSSGTLCTGTCPDHTNDVTQFTDKLAGYFGRVIGCDTVDPNFLPSDFPIYDIQSMTSVHSTQKINKAHFNAFVNAAASVFQPILSASDFTLLAGYLLNFGIGQEGYTDGRLSICNVDGTDSNKIPVPNQTDRCDTICDFYATATGQNGTALVTGIVVGAFGRIVAPGNRNREYFTTVAPNELPINPSRSDYVNDGAKTNALVAKLVSFFGQQGVLSCAGFTETPSINPQLHQTMGLDDDDITQFNSDVAATAQAAGVDPNDLTIVGDILESTRAAIKATPSTPTIIGVPSVPQTPGPTNDPNNPQAPSSASVITYSFFLMSLVAFLLF